ncbi:MAG TPA: gliding motility-associated C-terminal domain-containing protein, partial [Bacteroidales bacterium]|nr:gliding motility-associated C-terminal domain-containing protein [Bacteroidales bacterium]
PQCPSIDKFFEVSVINTVPVNLSSNDSDNRICPGEGLSLSVEPQGFERYVFMNSADTLQDSIAHTLTFDSVIKDYNITAHVYQNNCLTTTSELNTEIITLPEVTMTASASGDVCRNEPIEITASPGFNNYLISNGDYIVKESNENVTEILLNDTMLTVTAVTNDNCYSTSSDTLYFSILEPPVMEISCSSDTICYGEYTSYYAYPQDLLSYTFYNGSVPLQNSESDFYATDSLRTGDIISVVGLGQNGCLSEHKETEFPYLVPYPDYTIGTSKEGICLGDSIELSLITDLTGNNFTYQWSTGETSDTIVVSPNKSKEYSLLFSDGGRCNDIEIDDQLVIVDTEPPPVAEAGDPATICIYDSTLLEASGGNSYQWSPVESLDDPDIANPYASPIETTTFYVTATNTFCTDIDSVTIIVDLCLEELTNPVPQIISPNEDGINDYWEILNIDYFENNSVKIFNRWGNEVYTASPYNNEWNGITNQGAELPDGTYFYIIKLGNGTKEETGFVVIHR